MALVERATRLSEYEFQAEADPAFRKVFKTFDLRGANSRDDIFQSPITGGVVLECDCFDLHWDQFAAIAEAALELGDDSLLFTILYAGTSLNMPTWRLPLIGYEEYRLAYDRSSPDEKASILEMAGIPLERVLYSPRGQWGVLSFDPFSIVGGTAEFVRSFKRAYPFLWEDLAEFKETMSEAGTKRGMDVSWVKPLLRSLYAGDEFSADVMEGLA